jgi:hypothetical protein
MARAFQLTTAEQVVEVVGAVSSANRPTDAAFISQFLDTSQDAARAALFMATDLGFLAESAGMYTATSPLCRFLRIPAGPSKAAILRVMLEGYEPFLVFRRRLAETGRPDLAGLQTKTLLEITSTRNEIADTLISFGTYAGAIEARGAGQYAVLPSDATPDLSVLAAPAADEFSAEQVLRGQLGARAIDLISAIEVIRPLAKALVHARAGEPDSAVQEAGTAVESFLTEYGNRAGVNTAAVHGINAKAAAIGAAGHLPPKLKAVSGYLGHLRNAADHGVDADIGSSWTIRSESGLVYVFAACAFINACVAHESGQPHVL